VRRSQIFLMVKMANETSASMDGMMVQRLFVTMGDPAGVGPELALRAVGHAKALGVRLAIVGSAALLQRVANAVSLPVPPAVSALQFLAEGFSANGIDGRDGVHDSDCVVIDVPGLDAEAVVAGHVNAATGRASLDCVNWSIDAVLAGRGDAVVTGPIHKEAWHAAGAKFPGHTELFAERAGAARHCMMLAAPSIRCALVTVHVGLAEVPEMLSVEAILQTIELASQGVSRLLGRPARVTVLGLNPHAGEGGLFGNREEERLESKSWAPCRQTRRSFPRCERKPTYSFACTMIKG
jgi:4-phospho-D-threonate 3-dehydrogenase / 4-phospho-D-erythronate 3-dehydrogenase